MIIPPYLKPGSKIRIISPAGVVDEKNVLAAAQWLIEQGYQTELGMHVFERHFQYAGTDRQRLHDLQEALDDPETEAILCSRGGYGTMRIIEQVNFTYFRKKPKWIAGFSDITILHAALHKMNIASIHGTMPRLFYDKNRFQEENVQSLIDALTGKSVEYLFPVKKENRTGETVAPIIGGNLSIMSSLMGTPYELDTSGKILFIEDLDEYLYHIDRMMQQLKMAGKLKNLAGLIAGSFTDMKDNETPFGLEVNEIIQEAVEEYNYPVCFDFHAGHDLKNLALVFGCNWHLVVSENHTSLGMELSQNEISRDL